MELVLLTVLIAAEIVLSVLTLKKGDDKSLWMKNRITKIKTFYFKIYSNT